MGSKFQPQNSPFKGETSGMLQLFPTQVTKPIAHIIRCLKNHLIDKIFNATSVL